MDTIGNYRDKPGGFFRTFEVSGVSTKASLTGIFHLQSTVEHIQPASGRPVLSAAHRAEVAVNPPGTLCEGKGHMRRGAGLAPGITQTVLQIQTPGLYFPSLTECWQH